MTSANKNNIGLNAYIDIAFDTLSPANKDIALRLGILGENAGSVPRPSVKIPIPVTSTTTVGEIRNAVRELVSQFENQ